MKKTFYGWWLLLGLFLIYAASNGIGLNTLPLFYPSLRADFNWTEAQVTGPATLMFLMVSLISPFVGFLLDRFRTKTLMIVGGIGLVGGLAFYATINSLGQLTTIYIVYAFSLTLAGIIPSMYLITKWFNKYRGLAIGIFLMASSVGGSIFPPIAGAIIEDDGWRSAAFVLTVIAGVLILIPVVFLVRSRPEDLGLYPDGADHPPRDADEKEIVGVTLLEALSSPIFYLLLLITASMWFCITGVINNQTLYFDDLKIDAKLSGLILGVFFVSSLTGKFLFGYLSDRYSKKNIMLLATLNLTLGSILLPLLNEQSSFLLYLYAIVYGIGFSGAFTMIQVLVAEYYQGPSYGSILGLITGVDTFAGSMGIIILSSMRTAQGNYYQAFNLLIGICVVASVCVLIIRKPKPSYQAS